MKNADEGWRQRAECRCASVMTRQTERMVLTSFSALYSTGPNGTAEADE